jgi:PAS domain S-box-containing protein
MAPLALRNEVRPAERKQIMLPRFSILKKFVFAFLVLSIIPLCALGISTLRNLRAIGQTAVDSTTQELEKRAKESLEVRAVEVASKVTAMLQGCEADLVTLAMLPRNADVYRQFSLQHRKTIWTREGTNENPVEVRENVPLYREIAYIGTDGMEKIRIEKGRIAGSAELRDVSDPQNTTYKSEHYFRDTVGLKAGNIRVSHVAGWYVSSDEQLQGARSVEEAIQGKKYEGVVRFSTPCFSEAGTFEGIVVLSLDHRHLMELTLHILPTDERFVIFPSYSSGNYAFMFDDEGWMVSHPKFSDIRGYLPDGSECNPADSSYTRAHLLAGEVPFNLDYAGFIGVNYPLIARKVRKGQSGVTNTFNVGGIPRVMAYAPIFYNRAPYDKFGIFGGITIGVQTDKFAEPALLARAKIDEMVRQTKHSTMLILIATAFGAISLGIVLARKFTRPIMYLARKAQQIAEGHIPYYVAVETGDELELLAQDFEAMATEIRRHRESLEKSLAELSDSRMAEKLYSLELEKQLKVLKNVHFLSQYLSTVYDRKLVLQTVLKTCVQGLGYDRAILYLYDDAMRRLTCFQTFGFSPEHEERVLKPAFHVERHDCIPTRVFRLGETIFVRDVRTDSRATSIDLKIADTAETDSFVFAPIKSHDRVLGVLGADTKSTLREIREGDVESLEILANDAARTIERSELYAKLISERNFIRSIVTSMTIGIITLEGSGKVTWFNPYSETVFKIKPGDALGKHYGEVFAALPEWIKVIDRYLQSPKNAAVSLEYHSLFRDGAETVLEVHASWIDQQRPHRDILVLFMRNVTQRKRLEEHMRRSDRLASLGFLAAGIAHEMRNPLTGLSLVMDDLHDHLWDRHQERDLIRRSLDEIDRLENLIKGLLDFAVPSRVVNLEVRPLGDVLENTLFLVRKLCKDSKITLALKTDEALPLLQLDPEKLQQALLNLLLNAIQAMPQGGTLNVEVKRVPPDESLLRDAGVRVTVSDTGKGIAEEDIPYIFDPFFTRSPSGCGLGLAIVHSVVQEHHGRISVSSQEGNGTIFWVDLPALEEASTGASDVTGSQTPTPGSAKT